MKTHLPSAHWYRVYSGLGPPGPLDAFRSGALRSIMRALVEVIIMPCTPPTVTTWPCPERSRSISAAMAADPAQTAWA